MTADKVPVPFLKRPADKFLQFLLPPNGTASDTTLLHPYLLEILPIFFADIRNQPDQRPFFFLRED